MSLRTLLTESQVVLPGIFNAITAQQAVACGHPALYLSGAGLTNALTGYPDIALLTLTEFAPAGTLYLSRCPWNTRHRRC